MTNIHSRKRELRRSAERNILQSLANNRFHVPENTTMARPRHWVRETTASADTLKKNVNQPQYLYKITGTLNTKHKVQKNL
jgi:hypothetical protein